MSPHPSSGPESRLFRPSYGFIRGPVTLFTVYCLYLFFNKLSEMMSLCHYTFCGRCAVTAQSPWRQDENLVLLRLSLQCETVKTPHYWIAHIFSLPSLRDTTINIQLHVQYTAILHIVRITAEWSQSDELLRDLYKLLTWPFRMNSKEFTRFVLITTV